MASKRSRGVGGAYDGVADNVPRDEAPAAEPEAEEVTVEEAGQAEVVEAAQEPEPQDEEPYVRLNGPYTADGVNVMDASGVRVAIAGYDDNRAASGPGLAHMIAKGLNKLKPQR